MIRPTPEPARRIGQPPAVPGWRQAMRQAGYPDVDTSDAAVAVLLNELDAATAIARRDRQIAQRLLGARLQRGTAGTDEPVLDTIRADLEEIRTRWAERDEDLYGLLAAAGRLIDHCDTLLAIVAPTDPTDSSAPNRPEGGDPPAQPAPNVVVMQGLVIRPGDVLIVQFASRRSLSPSESAEYKERLKQRLPDLADVVLMADTSGLAVYRESE